VQPWEGEGTHVEVTLRGALADVAKSDDCDELFEWAQRRSCSVEESIFKGKSSAYWYDLDGFLELVLAGGERKIAPFLEPCWLAALISVSGIAGDWQSGRAEALLAMRQVTCSFAPEYDKPSEGIAARQSRGAA